MADEMNSQDQENGPAIEPDSLDEQSTGEAAGENDAAEAGSPEKTEADLRKRMKEAVEVDSEEIGTLRKKLTIRVPRDLLDEQKNQQFGELRRDALVPGFRRGRAPRRLLEKRFGNDVDETLVQQLVSAGYLAAVEKLGLAPIGDPFMLVREKDGQNEKLVNMQEAIEIIELPAEGPLTFACEVEVQPQFELPPLEGIPVTRPVLTITDEHVDSQVHRLLSMNGKYIVVPEGPVEPDDRVHGPVKVAVGDTVLFELDDRRLFARSQTIDGIAFAKLGEALVGAKPGETRTATATVPDDDVRIEQRGKEATLTVEIREVQRFKPAEPNEQFLKALAFESVEEMREFLRQGLSSRVSEQVAKHMREQVTQYLLRNTNFELPEVFSRRQLAYVKMRTRYQLYREGVPPEEVSKRLDEMETVINETAISQMRIAFIMEKLAETIKVNVTDSEINSVIANMARQQGRRFDRVREDLHKQGGEADIYMSLRDEKILGQLLAQAKITDEIANAADLSNASEATPKVAEGDQASGQDIPDAT